MSTPTEMIPVQKYKAWSIPHNRFEIWEAVSEDGKWSFIREESPGTPWIVTHVDFPDWYAMFSSLTQARKRAERQLHFDLTVGLDNEMSRP